MELLNFSEQLTLEAIIERLNLLYKQEKMRSDDRGRVRNHLMRAHIKAGNYGEALKLCEPIQTEPLDYFHLYAATRATTDALLAEAEGAQVTALRLLKFLHQPVIKQGLVNLTHPAELIFREWGMLEFLTSGGKNSAMQSLQQSRNGYPTASPIYNFLSNLLNLHQDFIEGKNVQNFARYFKSDEVAYPSLLNCIDRCAEGKTTRALLRAARLASPY